MSNPVRVSPKELLQFRLLGKRLVDVEGAYIGFVSFVKFCNDTHYLSQKKATPKAVGKILEGLLNERAAGSLTIKRSCKSKPNSLQDSISRVVLNSLAFYAPHSSGTAFHRLLLGSKKSGYLEKEDFLFFTWE